MRILHIIMLSLCALLSGCSEKDPDNGVVDPHADAISKFQAAQQLFKTTVATVRDEASFDEAAPALNEVAERFSDVASMMKELDPPDESTRKTYQKMISDGHRQSEPTAFDMMSILTIESREKQVNAWMESFTTAGQEAGVEMLRLYGQTDYSVKAAASRKRMMDKNRAEIDQVLSNLHLGPEQNQKAEQNAAGQSSTAE